MNTLILFYSRTGTTKILAGKIEAMLSVDIEEIIDKKNRSGAIGYIMGGRDALKKFLTKIEPLKKDLTAYDLIIIGTPVWAGTMVPAVRTVITEQKANLKKLAFFTTQGGAKEQRVLGDLEALSGIKPEAKMFLTTKEVKNSGAEKKIIKFVQKCRQTLQKDISD
jgi:flavodoxin